MSKNANTTTRPNIAIRMNAAKAAKEAFDAQVMNVTNRTKDSITVEVDNPDNPLDPPIFSISGKTDVWNMVGEHLEAGEYTGTVTHGGNVLNVHITVNDDKTVIRRVSHWTR